MTARATGADLRRIGTAAEQIGVSKRTLYRAADMGRITLTKAGKMTFVSMVQLQEWISTGGNSAEKT